MTTDNNPETLDGHSLDVADERRRELLRLFPEVRTEGGKLDFDKLKLALGEAVDVGRERYGMNWPGKAECFRTIWATSSATLRPCREESVDFDTTQNLQRRRQGALWHAPLRGARRTIRCGGQPRRGLGSGFRSGPEPRAWSLPFTSARRTALRDT